MADRAGIEATPLAPEDLLTKAQVRALLREQIAAVGGQTAWAEKRGISASLVSDALNGRDDRDISPTVLAALGLLRTSRYARVVRRKAAA